MKDKATLYNRSNPHRFPAVRDSTPRSWVEYHCYIGTWENARRVVCRARTIPEAINLAKTRCRPEDDVVEVQVAGEKVWDCFDFQREDP